MIKKLRVGVLMGGMSVEKEVSFNSGRTVCDHLDSTRYEVLPIFHSAQGLLYELPWRFLYRGKISDFEHRLQSEARCLTWQELPSYIDFMYICLHGRYAEDGTLQGALELLKIPYLGPKILANAFRADKAMHKKLLIDASIQVPRFIALSPTQVANDNVTMIEQAMQAHGITYPCIVKPHHEGSSLGVRCVHSPQELMQAVHDACYINDDKAQTVLIEEKIEGMEFSCIVLTDYRTDSLIALPPTEIVPETNTEIFDYDQKYMPGRSLKFTPARCSERIIDAIQQVSKKVMQALSFTNLLRVDGFVTPDERIVIIDPNAISGMGPTSFLFKQAAHHGFSHAQLINHLIETELHAYGLLDNVLKQEANNAHQNSVKKRIGVIFGGDSNEREISLESGRNIIYKLCRQRYEAIPLFLNADRQLYRIDHTLLVCNATAEIEHLLTDSMKCSWDQLPTLIDFAFIALHGGVGENGSLQGLLELLSIPYNGSGVLASALCMDKFKTTNFLRMHGFEVPSSLLIARDEWVHAQEKVLQQLSTLTMPLITKPHDDGCSVQVSKIEDAAQLVDALEALFVHKQYALVEEWISGMELTVGVIGNEKVLALPPSQAKAAAAVLSIKEKFLPGAGQNLTPAPLSAQALSMVQSVMQEVYKTVGCSGYARIDCFYQTASESPTGKERIIILEINTLPGMTPATCIFHQAAEIGLRPTEFIDLIIMLGLQKHANKADDLQYLKTYEHAMYTMMQP